MPKNIPALKPRQLIEILEKCGCRFYREGKGDHRLYIRYVAGKKKVVPIDMGTKNFLQYMSSEYLESSTLAMRR